MIGVLVLSFNGKRFASIEHIPTRKKTERWRANVPDLENMRDCLHFYFPTKKAAIAFIEQHYSKISKEAA